MATKPKVTKKTSVVTLPEDIHCDLCNKVFPYDQSDIMLCYGCNKRICEDCNMNPGLPWGGHEAEDHKTLK